MALFPLTHNTQGWDSRLYKATPEDPALKTEMEGGYTVSRARHTRTPRMTWRFGWRSMKDSDYQLALDFWKARRGASETFTWVDPASITQALPAGITYTVRFKSWDGAYVGAGSNRMWDLNIEVEQL